MKISSLIFIFFLLISLGAKAQVPQTLSYQGLLTKADNSPVADGAHTIVFNFYTAATGGTAQPRTVIGVNTFQGLFTTIIGNGAANSANAPLNNLTPGLGTTQYYVGLQVDGGSELSPRVALTAVPYAFVASTLDASATVAGSQLNSPITNTAVTIPAAQITGTVTNAQLASGIDVAKIAGNLPGSQITGAITTATVPASQITGTLTNAQLASGIDVSKLTGNLPVAQVSGLGTLASKSTVTTAEITDGTIATADLADGAVTSAKLLDGTIATVDIADGVVTNSKLATGIDAVKITTNAVAVANGGTGAATATAARTNLGLGTLATLSAVTTNEITDGTIATADIATAAVTNAQLASGIDANKITSGAITLTTSTGSPVEGQLRYNSTEKVMEYYNGTNWYFVTPKVAFVKDIEPFGTDGGPTTITNNTWFTRTLTTLEADYTTFLTLTSNNTLNFSPGEYIVEAEMNSYDAGRKKIELINVANSSDVYYGESGYDYPGTYNITTSKLYAKLKLATATSYQIKHYVQTGTSNTFGLSTGAMDGNTKVPEIYGQVKITKLR